MIYKVKIWTTHSDEGLGEGFRDFYFDVTKITGFFIPEPQEGEEEAINVFFEGDMITLKQEPHIVNYLTKTFVESCKVS